MDDVLGFVIGLIMGAFMIGTIINTVDIPTDNIFKAIDICDPFGGLKYYDKGGDYTCGNGLVIEIDNYKDDEQTNEQH